MSSENTITLQIKVSISQALGTIDKLDKSVKQATKDIQGT